MFDLSDTIDHSLCAVDALARAHGTGLYPLLYHDVPRRLIGDALVLRRALQLLATRLLARIEAFELLLRVQLGALGPRRIRLHLSIEPLPDPATLAWLLHPGCDSLAQVWRLIDALGGRVQVAADPARLLIELPFAAPASALCTEPLPQPLPQPRPLLLADSGELSRHALQGRLQLLGYRVAACEQLAASRPPPSPAAGEGPIIIGISPLADPACVVRETFAALQPHGRRPVLFLGHGPAPPGLERCRNGAWGRRHQPLTALAAQLEQLQRQQMAVHDIAQALRSVRGSDSARRYLLGRFAQELPVRLQGLHAALAAADWQALDGEIHRLQGAAAVCALPALQAALNSLRRQLAPALEAARQPSSQQATAPVLPDLQRLRDALQACDHEAERVRLLTEAHRPA